MASSVVAVINSGFEYYDPIRIQSSIQERNQVVYTPVTALIAETPFEFFAVGAESEQMYMDLANSKFKFKVKATAADGAAPNANAQLSCVQNLAHSMFSRIEVELGGKMVCDANGLYPYRAYFADLLSRGKLSEETWMEQQGWFGREPAGKHDTLTVADNTAAKDRNGKMGTGQTLELIMRPHLEIFNSDKYIPPGVTLKIKFTPASNAFILKRGAAADNAKFVITEAKFFCRFVKATHVQDLAVHDALNKIGPLRMYQNRVTLKHMTIATGSTTAELDNIYFGPIPNRILVGMVSDAAASGAYASNPFNFKHFNCSAISLLVNGKAIPNPPYAPDFGGTEYKMIYDGMLEAINKSKSEMPISLTLSEFTNGYTIFAFDLTPDLNSQASYFNQGNGSVRLLLQFSQALAATVAVILHAEYDAYFEIDKYKNVITNY